MRSTLRWAREMRTRPYASGPVAEVCPVSVVLHGLATSPPPELAVLAEPLLESGVRDEDSHRALMKVRQPMST